MKQTPFLNVLAPDKVRGALKLLRHPQNARLTQEIGREVCLRTNSKAFVVGSIADAGNHYRIELRAVNCETAKTVAKTQVEAGNRNQVVRMLGVASEQLRRRFGEPEVSLEKFSKPLDEATTFSPDALQAWSQGFAVMHEKGDAEGLRYYQRAVGLDPNFAHAYLMLGVSYLNLGEVALSVKNETRAFELRERATERHRLMIEGIYYSDAHGELEKALQTYKKLIETYGTDYAAYNNSAEYLRILGRFEEAAAEAEAALRIMPNNYAPIFNLALAHIAMNRFEEAQSALDDAQDRKLDAPLLRSVRYSLAFLRHDDAVMQEQVAWAIGKPDGEDALLGAQANTESFYGRIGKARQFSSRTLDGATHAGATESAAARIAVQALHEATIGNGNRAQRGALEALSMSSGKGVEIVAALALAASGDVEHARALADKLGQQFPMDTMIQNYSLPDIRAATALAENEGANAIQSLQVTKHYELGDDGVGGLYPAYLRGLAYLRMGKGSEAADEFEKLIRHPGIVQNQVQGALAHLGLGRAYVLSGETAKAKTAYQDFLTLWKDADPDIPIYKQAKAEYAKLR